MTKVPRESVFDAIVSERNYQETKWPGHQHTVCEWITVMQKCLDDAKHEWFHGHGNDDATLSEIRQVVAVGVAAMEQHGAPLRSSRTNSEQGPRARRLQEAWRAFESELCRHD